MRRRRDAPRTYRFDPWLPLELEPWLEPPLDPPSDLWLELAAELLLELRPELRSDPPADPPLERASELLLELRPELRSDPPADPLLELFSEPLPEPGLTLSQDRPVELELDPPPEPGDAVLSELWLEPVVACALVLFPPRPCPEIALTLPVEPAVADGDPPPERVADVVERVVRALAPGLDEALGPLVAVPGLVGIALVPVEVALVELGPLVAASLAAIGGVKLLSAGPAAGIDRLVGAGSAPAEPWLSCEEPAAESVAGEPVAWSRAAESVVDARVGALVEGLFEALPVVIGAESGDIRG